MALKNTFFGGPLLVLLLGVASHMFYFRIGEHHMHGMTYFLLFSLACTWGIVGFVNFAESTSVDAIATVAVLGGSWLVGVYGSLLAYRALFHRLNKFPGPWQARLSDLWLSTKLGGLKAHSVIEQFHKQYDSQYIRVGSNTLSVTDPRIIQSAIPRGDWYDSIAHMRSLQMTRDVAAHERRRRIWAPAFSDKAVREYEVSSVVEMNDKLLGRIEESKGQPLNMRLWFNLYSFDVMGRLAFGKDYSMIESGKRPEFIDMITHGTDIMGLRLPTWLFVFMQAIPGATAGHENMYARCGEELKRRVQQGDSARKDVIGWLLKAYADVKRPEVDKQLRADTVLVVVAGSDTTATTLTCLFYYLARNSDQVEKLRKELRPLTKGDWSDKDIQHAEHLNGAINETLRLHPPVPSGLKKKTPPQGLHVGDTFIPGDVDLFCPMYAVGRDERIYPDALSFIPERWYSKPDMIRNVDAFAPFSTGIGSCIGKNLARLEIRTLTAKLILKYDVAFAPGEDGSRMISEARDHFVYSPSDLQLVFKPASS